MWRHEAAGLQLWPDCGEQLMSALPLSRLTTQPIRIPVYRNERIRKFALWFADNDAAIAEYFNALKPYCEEGCEPLVDFFAFSAIQHEREELKLLGSDAGTPSGADADLQVARGPAGSFLEQVLGSVEVIDERLPHGGSL